MPIRPWPEIPEKYRWAVELMEERLALTTLPSSELSARSAELRAQAAVTGLEGYRDAALALADRYDQAAAGGRRSA